MYVPDILTTQPSFEAFPKIARLSRECVVSEKLDGTSGQVMVTEAGEVLAGSRNRWVTPTADNHGFAKWVEGNKAELLKLGPGRHYGEWWGSGVGRNYGLKEKRFSLFNASRWGDDSVRPACCHVVPVLYRGMFDTTAVDDVLRSLSEHGSAAVPGWMEPEGVVVFHVAGGFLFKKTLDSNDISKGAVAA
jgi:hypothetical protein